MQRWRLGGLCLLLMVAGREQRLSSQCPCGSLNDRIVQLQLLNSRLQEDNAALRMMLRKPWKNHGLFRYTVGWRAKRPIGKGFALTRQLQVDVRKDLWKDSPVDVVRAPPTIRLFSQHNATYKRRDGCTFAKPCPWSEIVEHVKTLHDTYGEMRFIDVHMAPGTYNTKGYAAYLLGNTRFIGDGGVRIVCDYLDNFFEDGKAFIFVKATLYPPEHCPLARCIAEVANITIEDCTKAIHVYSDLSTGPEFRVNLMLRDVRIAGCTEALFVEVGMGVTGEIWFEKSQFERNFHVIDFCKTCEPCSEKRRQRWHVDCDETDLKNGQTKIHIRHSMVSGNNLTIHNRNHEIYVGVVDSWFLNNEQGILSVSKEIVEVNITNTYFGHNGVGLSFEGTKLAKVFVNGSRFENSSHFDLKFVDNIAGPLLAVVDSSLRGAVAAIHIRSGPALPMSTSGSIFENNDLECQDKHPDVNISNSNFSRNGIGFESTGARLMKVFVDGSNFANNHHFDLSFVDNIAGPLLAVVNSSFRGAPTGIRFTRSPAKTVTINQSIFENNDDSGLSFRHPKHPYRIPININNCNFSRPHLAAIYCAGTCELFVRSSRIEDAGLAGLFVQGEHSTMDISNVVITKTLGTGVCFRGHGTGSVVLRGGFIKDNGNGISVDADDFNVSNLEITGGSVGIHVLDASSVELRRMELTDNLFGLYAPRNLKPVARPIWIINGYFYLNELADVIIPVAFQRDTEGKDVTKIPAHRFQFYFCALCVLSVVMFIAAPLLQKSPRRLRNLWREARMLAKIWLVTSVVLWCTTICLLVSWRHALRMHFSENRVLRMWNELLMTSLVAFFVGALGRGVSEAVRRQWTVMSELWIRTRQERDLMMQKVSLQQQIKQPNVYKAMGLKHVEAWKHWCVGQTKESDEILSVLKASSRRESIRLGHLAQERISLYNREPDRMAHLIRIQSKKIGDAVQDRHLIGVEEETNESYVASMERHANWCMPEFTRKLTKIVDAINDADHPSDLKSINMLPQESDLELHFQPDMHMLKPERVASRMGCHCGLIFGPVKKAERALVKIRTDYHPDVEEGRKTERPAGRYVCDWLRATVFTEDPYMLALCFSVFQHELEFVRVKNNFTNIDCHALKQTNMLANFRMHVPMLDVRHVFEVQFKLQDLLTITSAEHLFYDVVRAQSFQDLVSRPLFQDDGCELDDNSEFSFFRAYEHTKLMSKLKETVTLFFKRTEEQMRHAIGNNSCRNVRSSSGHCTPPLGIELPAEQDSLDAYDPSLL